MMRMIKLRMMMVVSVYDHICRRCRQKIKDRADDDGDEFHLISETLQSASVDDDNDDNDGN